MKREIHAYDKLYLERAMSVLARMLDYAVYDLKYDITEFFNLFISSGLARKFETGDPSVVAGRSGVELAYMVLETTGMKNNFIKPQYSADRSEEYWTGWALAYYQWYTSLSFAEIIKDIPVKDIKDLYDPYHEMDIRQFCDRMNEMYKAAKPETNLKILRRESGLSQSQLAAESGISVRTIQNYEQRVKDINKAQADNLMMIAYVLNCSIEDLMERI